jgi:hypothetical protein
LAGTARITLTGNAVTLSVTRRTYPAPPTGFVASPDVSTLWNRYEGHVLGREPLPGMGYFCLSVVEWRYGGRKGAAEDLKIDFPILKKLGELTSRRGDEATARKQEGPLQPLTGAEEEWIRVALMALIRQLGMKEGGAPLSPVKMAKLPTL